MSSFEEGLQFIDLSRVGTQGSDSHYRADHSRSKNSSARDNALVRSPKKDEFKRNNGSRACAHSKKQTSYSKNASLKHKGSAGSKSKSNNAKAVTREMYENMTPEERREYRAERRRQRQIAVLKKRIAAACAAITILGGGGAVLGNHLANRNATIEEIQASTVLNSNPEDENFSDTSYLEPEFDYNDSDIEISTYSDVEKTRAIQGSAAEKIIEVTDDNVQKIDRINEILDNNPEIRAAFNDVEIALRRASIEYGGNVVDLLNEMDEKFGCGKIAPGLMACVMEQETSGFFSDWKTNEVLCGADGDTGWYQITDIAESDFDRVANWLKKQGVAKEDIDEILNAGRRDMRGNAGRGAMKLAFLSDKYGDDIAKILSAYNAGEGFANNGNIRKAYVHECYEEHLAPLSEYEEIWDYILNKDYYEFEEDGVPHVYVNPVDGSVRYPD